MPGGFLEALVALCIGLIGGLAWIFKLAGNVKVLEAHTEDLRQKIAEQDTLVRDVTTQLAVIETKLKNTDEKLDLIRTDLAGLTALVRNSDS